MSPAWGRRPLANPGIVPTGGVCALGHWNDTVGFEGEEMRVANLVGWVEEFSRRW